MMLRETLHLLVITGLASTLACSTAGPTRSPESMSDEEVDALLPVDCLLPGKRGTY